MSKGLFELDLSADMVYNFHPKDVDQFYSEEEKENLTKSTNPKTLKNQHNVMRGNFTSSL